MIDRGLEAGFGRYFGGTEALPFDKLRYKRQGCT